MRQRKLEETNLSQAVAKALAFAAGLVPKVLDLTVSYVWSKIIDLVHVKNLMYIVNSHITRWNKLRSFHILRF